MSAGQEGELKVSRWAHQRDIPLLVSSRSLRSRGLGQVDVAVITLGNSPFLKVIEVKTNRGQENLELCTGRRQRDRLQQACAWLALILDLPGLGELKLA